MSSVIKDQLLSEYAFINYCNLEPVGSSRRLTVTTEFIQAVKKDGLIKPMLRVNEEVAGVDGATRQTVEYYSRHQLFLMVALRNNVLKANRLDSPEPMAFGAKPMRTILWGTAGYTVYADSGKPIGKLPQPNLLSIATKFHRFLKLLHSCPEADKYSLYQHDRGRLFNGAANARYVFDGLDETALKNSGLSVDDLKLIRQAVGSMATSIDPLKHWYYYLQKHSQRRKDVLKGDAGLAQELYLTEKLIVDVIEKVSDEKQPPLLEVLYQGGIKPFMLPTAEYARGCDTAAIESAIGKLRVWSTNKQNAKLLPQNFEEQLKVIEDDLKDYIARYKGRGYLFNEPRQVQFEDWPLSELDDISRAHVEAGMERWEQKAKLAIKSIEQINTEREAERINQVTDALWYRLSEIQGRFHLLASEIRDVIISETDKAWREVHNPYGQLRDKATDRRLFRQAKAWEPINNSFNSAIEDASLIFCLNCRKKRVLLHTVNGDRRISTEPICDTCIANAPDLAKVKSAEWHCDFCGRLLYKFAYGNKLQTTLLNSAVADITLEYGLLQLKVRCPNNDCKQFNRKAIDWGWGV